MFTHKITSLVMRSGSVRVRPPAHSITAGQAGSDHKTDTVRNGSLKQSSKQFGTAARIARTIHVSLAGLAVVLVGLIVVLNHSAQAEADQILTETQVKKLQPSTHITAAGCTATADWPKGQIPATAQVQPFDQYDRPVTTVTFDEAWTVNHDADKTNDLYVVGLCR